LVEKFKQNVKLIFFQNMKKSLRIKKAIYLFNTITNYCLNVMLDW